MTTIQEQEAIYHLLNNLQTELINKLKDGIVARDVYQHAISYIREKKPELEKNFVKNVGFGVSHFNCAKSSQPTDSVLDGYGIPRLGVLAVFQKYPAVEDRHGFERIRWFSGSSRRQWQQVPVFELDLVTES